MDTIFFIEILNKTVLIWKIKEILIILLSVYFSILLKILMVCFFKTVSTRLYIINELFLIALIYMFKDYQMKDCEYKVIVKDKTDLIKVCKKNLQLWVFCLFVCFCFCFVFKNEEIKRVINLLKHETSDHLHILEDLYEYYDKCLTFSCY